MTTTATRPMSKGDPGYTETMPCEPQSAKRARALVATVLRTWGIGDLLDAGMLIVDELVTNAIDHTPCRTVRVVIRRVSGTGYGSASPTAPARSPASEFRTRIPRAAVAWSWSTY